MISSHEIMADITAFMTMAYVSAVNPGIFSATGMEFGNVFAAIETLVM